MIEIYWCTKENEQCRAKETCCKICEKKAKNCRNCKFANVLSCQYRKKATVEIENAGN